MSTPNSKEMSKPIVKEKLTRVELEINQDDADNDVKDNAKGSDQKQSRPETETPLVDCLIFTNGVFDTKTMKFHKCNPADYGLKHPD
jgi:hypothetical protein